MSFWVDDMWALAVFMAASVVLAIAVVAIDFVVSMIRKEK